MNNAQKLASAFSTAGSQFVSVIFTKKDGTERQMTINPMHFVEIKGTGKACSDPNIFRVMDAKLNQWRSIDARRVISVKVAGQIIQFQEQSNA